ncbi:hypothetical protein CR513_05374, partial [Mucuna pruriens]
MVVQLLNCKVDGFPLKYLGLSIVSFQNLFIGSGKGEKKDKLDQIREDSHKDCPIWRGLLCTRFNRFYNLTLNKEAKKGDFGQCVKMKMDMKKRGNNQVIDELIMNHIPSKVNLLHKNINVGYGILYLGSSEAVKNVDHLFFELTYFSITWTSCLNWLDAKITLQKE